MIKTDVILTTEYTESDLWNAVCGKLGKHAPALRGGIGSLLGYVLCMILKLCAVGYFALQFYHAVVK